MRIVALALIAGCGTTSSEPFLIETTDCALVNNLTVEGQATTWNDCRVYWSGTNMLTVEVTTSGTSGSFLAPALAWIRASVEVSAGDVSGTLLSTAHPASTLPTSVAANQIALDLPIVGCGNIGANGLMVDTMADVGNASASFSIKLNGTCDRTAGQGPLTYSGGFIVSASGASPTSDPATVVGPLP